jgi:hypothetical protein
LFLRKDRGNRSGAEPQPVDRYRGQQQRPGQDAGQLRGERRQLQAVAEHRDREQTKDRSPQRAATPEHRRTAQHDGRNRIELVPVPGIRPRLSEMRDIDDRRQARDDAREEVHETHATPDWNSGIARAGW